MDVERSRKGNVEVVWGLELSQKSPAVRRIVWGVFLMGLGIALLLGQFGLYDLPALWKLWPIVFFVIAVANLLERKPGGAAMMALLGASFLSVQFGWMGLTYRTFWPLVIVAVGVGIVIGALSGEDSREQPEA